MSIASHLSSIRSTFRCFASSALSSDRQLIFRLPARKPRHCSDGLWTLLIGLRIGIRGRPSIVLSPGDRDMPKAAFYAVAAGRKPGIYSTWAEAEAQVKGYAGAKFKKFNHESEARAFVDGGSSSSRSTTQAASTTTHVPPATYARGSSPVTHAASSELPPKLAALVQKGWRFSTKAPTALVVYTDGSGIGNGKKGAKAGLGVWWGNTGDALAFNLAERVPGELQTNNRGELLSVIRAIETCPFPDMPLEIRTDSQYTIMCMTTYLPIWLRNGFKTSAKKTGPRGELTYSKGDSRSDVKNADMIKHLLVLLRRRGITAPVRFKHVRGHIGVEGNEGADRLARMGAAQPPLPDRSDWLDPDTADTKNEPPSAVDVEIDEDWLMSPEELDLFERNFEEVVDR